jgi:hypothetical protein
MFINIKNPPRWNPKKSFWDQDLETIDFYLNEKRKFTEGFTINGYFVHPWLYWHMNFFKTPVPTKLSTGEKKEILRSPDLDDNFLYLIDCYKEAEEKNLGLMLFGTRGFGKSLSLSSLITWLNTTKNNGVTSITGGSTPDLKSLGTLMQLGFTNVHPAFKLGILSADWEKSVEFGIKEDAQSKLFHSRISIVNADPSKKSSTEKGAGLSPIGYVLDEALHEDSILYCLDGEISIKDSKIGDFIYGKDGKLTKIVDKINPGVVDLFEITLQDGRKVKASGNHLWTVYNTYLKRWLDVTTEDLLEKYYYTKYDKRYDKHTKSPIYSIPLNEPVEYEKKSLYLDPYWLGLYLGDGFTGTSIVCSEDKEILDYCKNYASELGMECSESKVSSCKNEDFRVANIVTKIGRRKTNKNEVKETLKLYDIYNEKRIPKDYLYSDIEDRMNLLKGIMDTDGSISKNGTLDFSTSILNFADDFEFLCRSLGISVIRTEKDTHYRDNDGNKIDCKRAHRFILKTKENPFKLSRKRLLFDELILKTKKQSFDTNRERVSIVNIEKVEKAQAYCIKVDNSDRLFLTDDFIVTHNCGKFAFKEIYLSALPSFKANYGSKLVPILSGTSGNADLSKDAKDVLSNPEAFRLLPMDWDRLERNVDPEYITWERSKKDKFCTFVPGQMSYRLETERKDTKLSTFLRIKSKELDLINVKETDWKGATEQLKKELALFDKIEDIEKQRMYYPLEIADVFITSAHNPFPTSVIDKHVRLLEDTGKRNGRLVNLYKTNSLLRHEFSDKKLSDTSHKGGEADAPIQLFGELPSTPPEKYIFVSGLDDYKLDQSDTDSLGAFYIIKRRNLEPNTPCEVIQASYVARPYRHQDFHKEIETLIEGYNSLCMMEAVDVSFKGYLDMKRKTEQLLAPSISFSNSVKNGKTKLNTTYGIYPTGGNKHYMFNLLIDWCKEEHVLGIDEEGNKIIKYGVEFIEDIDLLKEMLSYRKGGNFDRITAFMHALTYATELDKNNVMPASLRKKVDYDPTYDARGSSVRLQKYSNIQNKPSKVKLKRY